MRTRKNIYQIRIIVLGNILYCYLIGQNLSLKGMLTLSGLIGDDAPRNLPTYESSIDYIPTLSIAKELSSNTFLDAEWSYRLKKDYSGDSLYNKIYKKNRLWARYSSEKIEARLGLQKIIFGPTQILRSLSWFDTFDIKTFNNNTIIGDISRNFINPDATKMHDISMVFGHGQSKTITKLFLMEDGERFRLFWANGG